MASTNDYCQVIGCWKCDNMKMFHPFDDIEDDLLRLGWTKITRRDKSGWLCPACWREVVTVY